jgi:hypothetical protein
VVPGKRSLGSPSGLRSRSQTRIDRFLAFSGIVAGSPNGSSRAMILSCMIGDRLAGLRAIKPVSIVPDRHDHGSGGSKFPPDPADSDIHDIRQRITAHPPDRIQ